MSTLAGQAMHSTVRLYPYQAMGEGSHTEIAVSIRANMEKAGKGDTTKLKKEFLGRIYPLNNILDKAAAVAQGRRVMYADNS